MTEIMSSEVLLLDLPPEVLLMMMHRLDLQSLVNLAATCKYLQDLSKNELVWSKLISNEFGIVVTLGENFSPRRFYHSVLHAYRSALGVWRRLDLQYYGEVLRVRAEKDHIMFEKLFAPDSLEGQIESTEHIKIHLDSEDEVIISRVHTKQQSGPRVQVNMEQDQTLKIVDFAPFSRHECYERLESPKVNDKSPLKEGLFFGTYGGHGVEIIRLKNPESGGVALTEGIKVTGDPNVAHGEVTFRIKEDRCLDITLQDQQTMEDLQNFLQNPRFVDHSEESQFDFMVPADCDVDEEIRFDKCHGMWRCECQVAWHGGIDPHFIPGVFYLLSHQYFAVLFIDLSSISLYKRVTHMFFNGLSY